MPDLFLLLAQSVTADDVAAMFDDGDAFEAEIMAGEWEATREWREVYHVAQ